MKRYILFLLFIIVLTPSFCFAESEFIDIDSHWAKMDILTLVRDGAISGYSDETFKPDNPIRVDEFLKIIISETKLKLYRQGANWSETYAFAAIDHGLISKEDFQSFDRPLLRYEAARIVANYIDLKDVSKSKIHLKIYRKKIKKLFQESSS